MLGMVDGVLVLVDAAEGPMPQTKFVVDKALRLGLRPIVAISKMDRADARPEAVHEAVFDLFDALGATDAQLDFPTVYTSARAGWASHDPAGAGTGMDPLIETVLAHVPPPATDRDGPFRMLISLLESDPFLGRLVSGRVLSGGVETGQTVTALGVDGAVVEVTRLTKLLRARGLERIAGRAGRSRRDRDACRPQDGFRGGHHRQLRALRADTGRADRSAHDLDGVLDQHLTARGT